MRCDVEKLTKRLWYAFGGFSNPRLFRKHNGRCWSYYRDTSY